jgi:hypothetical protein
MYFILYLSSMILIRPKVYTYNFVNVLLLLVHIIDLDTHFLFCFYYINHILLFIFYIQILYFNICLIYIQQFNLF